MMTLNFLFLAGTIFIGLSVLALLMLWVIHLLVDCLGFDGAHVVLAVIVIAFFSLVIAGYAWPELAGGAPQ
jgi:hypothetical protein